ncbi:MAG: MFS transporter [Saprospiraceae bacterium]|nr:MFS transporter [Saprospiraceae bacterium]
MKKIGNYRWIICGLLFFATTINYLDRAVISLVKEYLDTEFTWTNSDYANITIAFQAAYAFAMIFAGRLIDWLGTKTGYAIALVSWSVAAMSHFFIKTNLGFIFARVGLGVTESGNFPAAIKTVSEWFPKKERSFATGIFNAGTNVGAIIAPLSVPFIAAEFGWRLTFLIIGAFGFIWLIFWYLFYDTPKRQKRLSKEEFDYIHSDLDEVADREKETLKDTKTNWFQLLKFKQTWAFALGKFLTDGVWWFYLFWLPDFLNKQYGLTKTDLALPTALVFIIATVGSVYGGWLPLNFITKGMAVFKARKTALLIYAACALPVIISQYLGGFNMWLAVLMIGFAASAHQAWSANLFTTVSDMFPKVTVGSVTGIGGMAGGVGGMLVSFAAGKLFDHYQGIGHIQTGYYIVFMYCGLAYLLAWTLMHFLVPRMQRVVLD